MNVNSTIGSLDFENLLKLASCMTKHEVMSISCFNWEAWPDNGKDTVSYRTIFNIEKNKEGNIYLIIDFSGIDSDSIISSWRFAPYKLLMGEQSKPEGKITKKLRAWFFESTKVKLPIYGSWGHIDAAYDPHNRTATIVCNYRVSFKDDDSWRNYCQWNKIKI